METYLRQWFLVWRHYFLLLRPWSRTFKRGASAPWSIFSCSTVITQPSGRLTPWQARIGAWQMHKNTSMKKERHLPFHLTIFQLAAGGWSFVQSWHSSHEQLQWKKTMNCSFSICHHRDSIAKKECRDPGSNQGPSDLQSDALPTELSRLLLQGR